jgi:DNA gyrase subunit A
VKGITLQDGDEIVSMITIKRPDTQIVIIGENGYGKRTKFEDFRLTRRGAKGVISMNVTPKTGKVVSLTDITDSDDLVVMTQKGILIRQPADSIRVIGRNTQGVRLIRLDEGDTIADITVVPRDDEEGAEGGAVSEE